MRKNVFGRHLKRDTNERKALFKGLISSLILHERIKTTEEKAKSIKALADKIITKAKKGEEKARRLLQGQLPKKAIDKVIFKIAPRFDKRQGGYTRIVRIGRRFSDNASVVLMEWVEGTQNSELKTQNLESQKLEKSKEEKTVAAKTRIQKKINRKSTAKKERKRKI